MVMVTSALAWVERLLLPDRARFADAQYTAGSAHHCSAAEIVLPYSYTTSYTTYPLFVCR